MSSLEFISEKKRLDSFKGKWKPLRGFKLCTPAKFAEAGFYYEGSHKACDSVRCFSCGILLGDWEKQDDPWEEHKRRGKYCKFVELKLKSKTTVRDFLELYYESARIAIIQYCEEKKQELEKISNERMAKFAELKS